MRIILLVSNDIRYDQRMLRITGTLHRAGWAPLLAGRRKRNAQPLPPYPFATRRVTCFFARGPLFYLDLNLRFLLMLCIRRPALVYAADTDTLAAAFSYHILFRKPLLFDAHELFAQVPELKKKAFSRWVWNRLEALAVPRATLAFTVSESLASYLTVRYQRPFIILRNLPYRVAGMRIDTSLRRQNRQLFYQGMLHEGRGLECLIRCISRLPEWTLVLAGDGDKAKELRDLVADLHLQNRVWFLGMLDGEALRPWVEGAWLGMNLLEERSQSYHLSLANKTFDYLQAHLPALHMDFPEYRRLAGETGAMLLLEKLEEDALISLIEELWMDERRYQKMTEAAAIAAQHLCWESETARLLTPLQESFPFA